MAVVARQRTAGLRDAAMVSAAILTGASGLAPLAGNAQTPVSNTAFTQLECNTIRVVITRAVSEIGPEKFTDDFKTSLRDFIGAKRDCTGPREIVTPTTSDIAGFNAIRRILLEGPNPISLQNAGLRSVPRRTAALGPS